MRVIIQRVSRAKVTIDNKINGEIEKGLMILVGFKNDDTESQLDWMCNKIAGLRIFSDAEGKMNLSVKDVNGAILLISNFTLYGDAQKGFRPSFSEAARPEIAILLYEKMIEKLKKYKINVENGIFGTMMDVELINDGPVTISIEK
jgi:D-tyrosyl-tRNA(Tyr) deacylase